MSNMFSTKILSGRVQRRLPAMRRLPLLVIASSVFGIVGYSQDPDPAAGQGKPTDHTLDASGPAQSAISDGYHRVTNFPKERRRRVGGYNAPANSTLAYSTLGFGPDTVLPKDPRYLRSGDSGLWRWTKDAIRATIFTHTDSAGGPLATWRFGSLYGASSLNEWWYTDRLNAMNVGLEQGSAQIAFDLRLDVRSEFWPDVKNKILHRKP
jgi:hypothetical protein